MESSAPCRSLVELHERSLADYGSRDLFGTKSGGRWRYITYREFGSLVERFRAGLAARGVRRGDQVAIISNNRVEWAVAAYACYGLGAIFVPMYEAQSPNDWEFIVRDCKAKVVLFANRRVLAKAARLLESATSLETLVLIDDDSTCDSGAAGSDRRLASYASLLDAGTAAAVHPSPDDVATLLYTSGTTGRPKGVVLSHANIVSNVNGAHQVFPIRTGDRSLSILPWAHAFGQTCELHTMMSFGVTIAIAEGIDKVLDNLAEVKPTVLCCVPTIFNRLYNAVNQQLERRPKAIRLLVDAAFRAKARERAGRPLAAHERLVVRVVDALVFKKVRQRLGGRLEFAISGGAALSRDVAEFIDALGIVVFEGYGLTETSPVTSANGPGARRIGSVGKVFPGVRVVIDTSATERGAGAPNRDGEIVVYGPNVMRGYFERPEETAAILTSDGGLRTGDMGYVDGDGFLFITGRIKEQYKLENGKYVVPSPLEEKLKLSPYIGNALVYGDNKPYNVALLVPNVAAIQAWGAARQIPVGQTVDELAKDSAVRELIEGELKTRAADFKGYERIVDFALVPDFTVESGMLTPKLSLKRRQIIEAYGSLIAQLYARGDTRPASRGVQPSAAGQR